MGEATVMFKLAKLSLKLKLKYLLGLLGKNVVITHVDIDGICCGAILLRYFKKAEVIFCSAGRVHEVLKVLPGRRRTLVIADLGLNDRHLEETVKLLEKLEKRGWSIYWLDHHRWSREALESVKKVVDLLDVDTSLVGGEVVCKHFGTDDFAMDLAFIARDADTIVRRDERTRTYYYALQGGGFKARRYLLNLLASGVWMDEKLKSWAAKGEKIIELSRKVGETAEVKRTAKGSRYAVLDLRGRKLNGVEAGNAAIRALGLDFCVVLYRNDRISMYRSEKSSVDVLGFVRKRGGGGHPYSCGLALELSFKSRLLSRLLGRRYFPEELEKLLKEVEIEL